MYALKKTCDLFHMLCSGWTDKMRFFPILVFHKEKKTMTTGKEPLSKTVWLALTFGKIALLPESAFL